MSIIVNAVSKIYGSQHAVDNISFELKKGEIVGFLGPNGAGKSTTMKMICGYLPATNGTIKVCGNNVNDKPLDVKRCIGYLPEANPLYYDMYVREYLEMSGGIHGIKKIKDRIEEMVTLTGLGKEVHKKIGMLSKGYKQRVGLAQAMLHNPEVLILDEPTTGLDPNQIIEIRELITRIGKEKTVLLSTHIMQEVQAMCSRVIIINSGKIVADDSINKIQQNNTKQDVLIVTFDKLPATDLFDTLKHKSKYELLPNGIKLYTNNPETLRKEVMQMALDNNININTMNTETLSLEDVFRTLTNNN